MRCLAVLLAGCVSLLAQDSFDQHWQALRSAQPAAVNLAVSAEKSEYYLGEPIRLHLSLTAKGQGNWQAFMSSPDRVVFPGGGEEVLADPAERTEDPWKSALSGGFTVSILGGVADPSHNPVEWEILVNDWIRFRGPGTYRIAVATHRLRSIEPVSEVLTLSLVEPPAGWASQQIAAAEREKDAKRAGAILRSLGTEESVIALAKRLNDGNSPETRAAEFSILSSPYRDAAHRMLEAQLVAPDVPVTGFLFDAVAGQKRPEYAARLVKALPSKQPEARAVSFETLLNVNGQKLDPAMAELLVNDFARLSTARQRELLEYRWKFIRSPRLLKTLLDIWNTADDAQLKNIAVRRIYQLSPDDGRRIILGELRDPNTVLTVATLSLLPDASLPELNNVFAAQLARGHYSERLMVRYATGDVVKQAEAAYEKHNAELDRQKLPHCGGSLVFYFLKFDPAYGENELRHETGAPNEAPVCYDIGVQFHDLDSSAWSPALEKLAIEFLSDPKVPVKRGAAEVLGKFGSAKVEKPLWDSLEYFHNWWQGRGTEPNEEGLQFERALRIALAQADAWVLHPDGLRRIEELCSSKWCRQEVAEWIGETGSPVTIMPLDDASGFVARIGICNVPEAALERKLEQFPPGTVFHLTSTVGVDELSAVVRGAGFDLR